MCDSKKWDLAFVSYNQFSESLSKLKWNFYELFLTLRIVGIIHLRGDKLYMEHNEELKFAVKNDLVNKKYKKELNPINIFSTTNNSNYF